jgi:uncharacterized membrane protein
MRTRFKVTLPSTERIDLWLSTKHANIERSEIILCLLILVYAIFFSSLTILRHWAFQTHAWDLGIYTQSLWTTTYRNKFLYSTIELFINPSGTFFGVHFSPMVLAFLPFYWIAPATETLLILQAFLLSLAAFPIYKLARDYAGGRTVGLSFAAAYLIYPAVHYVNLYEFHVQTFLPFLTTCTIYYSLKEKWHYYFTFLLFSLMVEEHVALIMAFFGVYLLWKYKASIVTSLKKKDPVNKRLLVPVVTIVLCVFWYWFTFWQRNTFFPINPAAMGEFLGSGNFGTLGAKSPMEVPLAIILNPGNAIQAVTKDGAMKLLYFVLIFGPLAFFSLKSPSLLIPTLPTFLFALISDAKIHHMLGVHYEAYTVSFIFAAGILGLHKILQKHGMMKARRRLKVVMLFSLIFFVVASPIGPVVSVLYPDYTSVSYREHERALFEVLTSIPANASILTQNNIFPHVSNRIQAYVIPSIFLNTGLRELAIDFIGQIVEEVEYILVDNSTDTLSTSFAFSLLENRTDFYLKESRDNNTIFLYQRKS